MRTFPRWQQRLLTRAQAAAYCGVSVATFSTLCPVRPIALGADKRLERYDIVALNEWVDSLGDCFPKRGRDWLEMMDADNDESAR
ncbi:MAG TPA: hypothetical protein VLZ74_10470 [Methylocella sp.]|nr:hypothetical protein [Methylocella sp.]